MRAKLILIPLFCFFLLCSFSGCDSTLRFAPTEAQKNVAELTHDLAVVVDAEGAQAASPATRKLVDGTRTNLAYIGRPASPPDIAVFDTENATAAQDAVQRPDPWAVADEAIGIGIAIAGIIGGGFGVRAAQGLSTLRSKSKALQDVVRGSELFKAQAGPEEIEKFKAAQRSAQSSQTAAHVSELKKGA